MIPFRRLASSLALLVFAISPVSAYYHYVHYNAAGQAINEKFDITALPNQTVSYFVTNSGPTIYPNNDSFSSVLSQVNQAISTWNLVGTSSIRLAFGGLFNPSTPLSATPGGQIEFTQLPPGYYGMTSVTTSTSIAPNAQFVPILYSTVYLTSDLALAPGPSYTSAFFLTTVHEIGHSLGLQHTYTSSAMSTAVTRATSLTRPIDADDIAGLSVLYPASNFSSLTGSISGRVTANGSGVHMASVVAIRNGYGAVSTLTNPDGTYEIDGIPPGQYYLYAHPLPPNVTSSCLNICAPIANSGASVSPSGPFTTAFLGGGTNLLQSTPIHVQAGQLSSGENFTVQSRNDVPVYDVTIYTGFGTNQVSPGFLNIVSQSYGNVLAYPTAGLTFNGKLINGTSAQVLGGSANVYAVLPYTDPAGNTFLNIGIDYSLGSTPGQQHFIFTQGNYTYVLPSALNLVATGPPSISSLYQNPDGSISIYGNNLAPGSLIYFDGLPATILSLNPQTGQAVVYPPPGASNQQSTVIVYNQDGQNSLFLQANSPVTFPYPAVPAPSFTLTPSNLPAGSEALIAITGTNTSFTQGQTVVGFGSSDVFVRSIIVQDATHILADVSIPAGAVNTSLEASVIAGFQIAAQPNAFQIIPSTQPVPTVIPVLQNATPGQTGAYPGAMVSCFGSNLETGSAIPLVTINGNPVPVAAATASSLTFQLPATLTPGSAAILIVNNGVATSFPVAVNISALPATITQIQNSGGNVITSANPISGGNDVYVYLSGFAAPTAAINPSQISINADGVNQPAVTANATANNLWIVHFVLSKLVPTGAQTSITVYLNGNSSYSGTLATSNN